MNPKHAERLKNVSMIAVPAVLGSLAVKNVREIALTKHLSYWEASHTFIIDLIKDGQEKAIRVSGRVLHGPGGREDIQDVELYEGFNYSDEDVDEIESNFGKKPHQNPLQTD